MEYVEPDAPPSQEGINNRNVEQLMICLHNCPFRCYSFIARRVMSGRIFERLTPGALGLPKHLSSRLHLHKFPIFLAAA